MQNSSRDYSKIKLNMDTITGQHYTSEIIYYSGCKLIKDLSKIRRGLILLRRFSGSMGFGIIVLILYSNVEGM